MQVKDQDFHTFVLNYQSIPLLVVTVCIVTVFRKSCSVCFSHKQIQKRYFEMSGMGKYSNFVWLINKYILGIGMDLI